MIRRGDGRIRWSTRGAVLDSWIRRMQPDGARSAEAPPARIGTSSHPRNGQEVRARPGGASGGHDFQRGHWFGSSNFNTDPARTLQYRAGPRGRFISDRRRPCVGASAPRTTSATIVPERLTDAHRSPRLSAGNTCGLSWTRPPAGDRVAASHLRKDHRPGRGRHGAERLGERHCVRMGVLWTARLAWPDPALPSIEARAARGARVRRRSQGRRPGTRVRGGRGPGGAEAPRPHAPRAHADAEPDLCAPPDRPGSRRHRLAARDLGGERSRNLRHHHDSGLAARGRVRLGAGRIHLLAIRRGHGGAEGVGESPWWRRRHGRQRLGLRRDRRRNRVPPA